jgi:prepilin-type N-terminal cleavage/methylation domain-containing protein
MLQKLRGNSQGFTLIELMIVIAIIGILAAIAIPNFIAYRNKAYCSRAESDANNIAAALSDYYSIPNHTTLETDLTLTLVPLVETRTRLPLRFPTQAAIVRPNIRHPSLMSGTLTSTPRLWTNQSLN